MYASVIQKILSQDSQTAPFFQGVFPADRLPIIHATPSCFVMNTDPQDKPGQHWVAWFIENKSTTEFFDSYGMPPSVYGFQISNVKWNNVPFQSVTSNVCGHYCIYFLLKRCQGQSMESIISDLSQCKMNDFRLFQFVKKRYGVKMSFKK